MCPSGEGYGDRHAGLGKQKKPPRCGGRVSATVTVFLRARQWPPDSVKPVVKERGKIEFRHAQMIGVVHRAVKIELS